jgi:hypothetical protein
MDPFVKRLPLDLNSIEYPSHLKMEPTVLPNLEIFPDGYRGLLNKPPPPLQRREEIDLFFILTKELKKPLYLQYYG